MSGRSGARRGRVRVRGGRGRGGMSSGRGKLTFVDDNPFSALDSDENGGSVSRSGLMDNRKSRQDKKRQRISTGTSDELYNDDDDYNDSDTEEMDDDDDNEQNDDFMQLSMDQKLAAMFTKISRTDVRVDRLYKEKLGRRVQRVESVLSAHEQRIKLLEYRSIDIEARSRRRNLLFKGIREYGQVENCFDLVRDFIADNLNIHDNMYLERAHRLGSLKQNQSKPRPIIVAFRDYYDTEMILQAAPDLKNTNYSVCRDYPKEITEARNKLWPHYKKARENPSAKVSIRYPARLVVDGVTTHDIFPDWFQVLNGRRVQTGSDNNHRNTATHNVTSDLPLSGQQSEQLSGRASNESLPKSANLTQPPEQLTRSLNNAVNLQQPDSVQRQNVPRPDQINIDVSTGTVNSGAPAFAGIRQNAPGVTQTMRQGDVSMGDESAQRPFQQTSNSNTTPGQGGAASPGRPPYNDSSHSHGDASAQNVR